MTLSCFIVIPLVIWTVVSGAFLIVLLLVVGDVKLKRVGVAEMIELIAWSCANISLTGANNSPVWLERVVTMVRTAASIVSKRLCNNCWHSGVLQMTSVFSGRISAALANTIKKLTRIKWYFMAKFICSAWNWQRRLWDSVLVGRKFDSLLSSNFETRLRCYRILHALV